MSRAQMLAAHQAALRHRARGTQPNFSGIADEQLARMWEALNQEVEIREEEYKHAREYIFSTEGAPSGNYNLIYKKTGEYEPA